MGTYRLLGKMIGSNKRLAGKKVSERAALAYLLGIPHTDSAGRFSGDDDELLATVAPIFGLLKGWTPEVMGIVKRELHAAGLWLAYTARGVDVIEVCRFRDHQHPSRLKTEPKSKLPGPEEATSWFGDPPADAGTVPAEEEESEPDPSEPDSPPPRRRRSGRNRTKSSESVRTRTNECPNRTEANQAEGKGTRTPPPLDAVEKGAGGPLRDTLAAVLARVEGSEGDPTAEDPIAAYEAAMDAARSAGRVAVAPIALDDAGRGRAVDAVGRLLPPHEAERMVAGWMGDELTLNAGIQVAERMLAESATRTWRDRGAYLAKAARLRRDELLVKADAPVEDVLDGMDAAKTVRQPAYDPTA